MSSETQTRTPVRVLLVEDEDVFARYVETLFRDSPAFAHLDVSLHRAATLREAEAELGRGAYDVVLLDLGLANSSGVETMQRAAIASGGAEPIIVLTGRETPDLAAEAIRFGMADFLGKAATGPAGATLAERMGRALKRAVRRDPQCRAKMADALHRVTEETQRVRARRD